MSGPRLVVGIIVMGVLLPVAIFLLLGLQSVSQLFTIAASTLLTWGVVDLLASILERPRLQDRTATGALREDLQRRHTDQ